MALRPACLGPQRKRELPEDEMRPILPLEPWGADFGGHAAEITRSSAKNRRSISFSSSRPGGGSAIPMTAGVPPARNGRHDEMRTAALTTAAPLALAAASRPTGLFRRGGGADHRSCLGLGRFRRIHRARVHGAMSIDRVAEAMEVR